MTCLIVNFTNLFNVCVSVCLCMFEKCMYVCTMRGCVILFQCIDNVMLYLFVFCAGECTPRGFWLLGVHVAWKNMKWPETDYRDIDAVCQQPWMTYFEVYLGRNSLARKKKNKENQMKKLKFVSLQWTMSIRCIFIICTRNLEGY